MATFRYRIDGSRYRDSVHDRAGLTVHLPQFSVLLRLPDNLNVSCTCSRSSKGKDDGFLLIACVLLAGLKLLPFEYALLC
jgi:hypothetical protein